MHITANGFVVHKQDLKDFDILVTIFSLEHGLFKAIAPRAKKKSNILAQLELFQESVFIVNRSENLGNIYHIDPKTFFTEIRDSYEAYLLASKFTIIIRALLPPDMPNPALYNLYRQYLYLLSKTPYNKQSICEEFYGAVLQAEGLAEKTEPVTALHFKKAIYEYCGVILD